jgi:N-acetylglucosamine-6-phosphate deacetylase
MDTPRGFVDLQVNGFLGVGFSDADLGEEGAVAAIRGLVADGTALLLPTLVTAAPEVYARNLPLLARLLARREFARHCPGLHLEGPFLSPREGAAGAHRPAWMREGEIATLDRLWAWSEGRLRLITIAPGIAGAPALIAHARRLGITVSLGHHVAGYDDLARAVDAGATALTHLGNGLPHLIDRHRNPLIDGLAEDRLHAMVIGDGHHLPWNLLKVILRAKGLERCSLVSDAAPIANHPAGTYACMGAVGEIDAAGRLADPATGYLMGSSFTIRRVVNATQRALGLDDATMRRLAIGNPLRLIGLPAQELAPLPRAADGGWLAPAAAGCTAESP